MSRNIHILFGIYLKYSFHITERNPAIFLFEFPTCESWNYTEENIALSNYFYCVMTQMIKTLRIDH